MNFPSASTQNTVRRRAVDPRLPVIKKYKILYYFIHSYKDKYCKTYKDKITFMLMLISSFRSNIKYNIIELKM